jgi:hypothetical protein
VPVPGSIVVLAPFVVLVSAAVDPEFSLEAASDVDVSSPAVDIGSSSLEQPSKLGTSNNHRVREKLMGRSIPVTAARRQPSSVSPIST